MKCPLSFHGVKSDDYLFSSGCGLVAFARPPPLPPTLISFNRSLSGYYSSFRGVLGCYDFIVVVLHKLSHKLWLLIICACVKMHHGERVEATLLRNVRYQR